MRIHTLWLVTHGSAYVDKNPYRAWARRVAAWRHNLRATGRFTSEQATEALYTGVGRKSEIFPSTLKLLYKDPYPFLRAATCEHTYVMYTREDGV